MNILSRTPALLSALMMVSLGVQAATEAAPAALQAAPVNVISASPLAEPADPTSLKALALLAAGVGMVVFVSRRRHDD
jgi:hypothetical protein